MALLSLFPLSPARRFGAVVILAAAGLHAGPAGAEVPAAQSAATAQALETSPYGDFLAARHAERSYNAPRAAELFAHTLRHSPDNPALMRQTMNQMLAAGRIGDAAKIAGRYLAHEPESVIAGLTLAIDDLANRKTRAAADRLEKIPMRGLGGYFVPLTLGWTKFALGDTEGAVKALEPLGRLQGSQPFVDYHAALMFDLAGDKERAGQRFEKLAADGFAGYVRFVEAAGSFWERHGERSKARDIYAEYLKRRPESTPIEAAAERSGGSAALPPRLITDAYQGAAEGLHNIATLLNQEGVPEIAMMVLQMSINLRRDFDAALLLKGDILAAMSRREDAIAAYDAIPRSSTLSWPARLRAAQLLDQADKGPVAYARLRDMAAERPTRADPLITLGDLLRFRKRFAEAVESYDAAIGRIGAPEQRYWSLYYSRGIALERDKKWPRAEADFLKALEFEPDQPLVLNYLGYSWVEKGLHLDRALGMLEKAVRLRPNDGYIVDSLGWAHYQLKAYDRAVSYLERAVELMSADSTINDHLGDAYWRVGRTYEARYQWSRALLFGPEPEELDKIRKKLAEGLPGGPVKREAEGGGARSKAKGRSGG
ncbi:MAG: hypothetical protein RL477_1973 [Pseudomonadota bacterium]|jgi:tetratricopeptide (TPR) repeat protein